MEELAGKEGSEARGGTTKAGLPCEEESEAVENCGEILDPEASKAAACELKSWLGTPPRHGQRNPTWTSNCDTQRQRRRVNE